MHVLLVNLVTQVLLMETNTQHTYFHNKIHNRNKIIINKIFRNAYPSEVLFADVIKEYSKNVVQYFSLIHTGKIIALALKVVDLLNTHSCK